MPSLNKLPILLSAVLLLLLTAACRGLPLPDINLQLNGATSTPIPNVAVGTPEPTVVPPVAEPADPTAVPTTAATDPVGRIAYITDEGHLATINPDGGDNRLLLDNGRYLFPSWSPTANKIAVIGGGRDESGMFVIDDLPTADPVSLYTDDHRAPIYHYWSPDGRQVSFIANSPGGLALHLAAADGRGDDTILATGQPLYWQWLANNQQALIHAGDERLSFVDIIEADENETGLGGSGRFQAPALSPDNRYIAYQEFEGGRRHIRIKDLRADEVIFDEPHVGILTMSWSPTDNRLVYTSPEEGITFVGPLLMYDVETDESRVITTDKALSFFWSPDGRRIAYLTTSAPNRQAKTAVGKRSAQQQRPQISLAVADTVGGGSRYLARFTPNILFISQFIPFFDQYALSHRIWSPNSQHLVIPMLDDDNTSEIWIVPVDGRPSERIATGVSAFWSHE